MEEELPPRPRRKLVTPATLGLAALAIAGGGFIGGVEVQKGQGGSSTPAASQAASFASRGGGGGARFGPPGGQQAGDFTAGTVANKHGRTLYVKDQSGNTIRIKTSSNAKVTRTASTSANGVHPGDTVIVTGTKHGDGSITASSIRATAKTASASGGFLGGGAQPGSGGPVIVQGGG
jgi:hypothetical protein